MNECPLYIHPLSILAGSKIWSIEEIQSEVDVAVKKVISILSSQQIDQEVGPMDEGLDSLGSTEQSDVFQSQLGVEFLSTFVLNNPTAYSHVTALA